eukprot:40693_1
MKRSRADDSHSTTNLPKKRRLVKQHNGTNNKTKLKLKHNKASILQQHQEHIRNMKCHAVNNPNNNALFYELSSYYFDDHIFKKLHSDIDRSTQQMFELIGTLQQMIHGQMNSNTNSEWILLLKFIVVTLKFHVEFIEQKANNDKAMFIKHCVPSNDLYEFNDKQRIKPFTKYYLELLHQQNLTMSDINRLYHKYESHSHHKQQHQPMAPFKAARPAVTHLTSTPLYPIYGQREDTERVQHQLQMIDDQIASIKSFKNEQFTMCQRRLCETNDNKLAQIARELKDTERFIKNKYECKETMIHNEYRELIERAKKRLLAKYQNKKSKQERLFKIEFGRHQRKIDKAHKKQAAAAAQKREPHKILFERDVYQRRTLLDKKTDRKEELVHFSNPKMQQKWKKICGIADREMEKDVNTMVADQDKGLQIKDILSMFPKCDVSYKSDKNVLQIGACSTPNASLITLKVASYIACRYTGQSIMLGQVKSISSQGLWCLLRQKGD